VYVGGGDGAGSSGGGEREDGVVGGVGSAESKAGVDSTSSGVDSVYSVNDTDTADGDVGTTSTTSTTSDGTVNITLPDGSFYRGKVKNDVPHGNGELLHTDGFISKGRFRNSALYSGVRYKKLHNDVYTERYVKGVKTGTFLVLADGLVLEGVLTSQATQASASD